MVIHLTKKTPACSQGLLVATNTMLSLAFVDGILSGMLLKRQAMTNLQKQQSNDDGGFHVLILLNFNLMTNVICIDSEFPAVSLPLFVNFHHLACSLISVLEEYKIH